MRFNTVVKRSLIFPRQSLYAFVCFLIAGAANATSAEHGERGARLYEVQCASCHGTLGAKESERQRAWIGPDLCRAVGRKAGSDPAYAYSKAMRKAANVWNEGFLMAFILEPQSIVPGNRMPFSGMDSVNDAADIAKYLTISCGDRGRGSNTDSATSKQGPAHAK